MATKKRTPPRRVNATSKSSRDSPKDILTINNEKAAFDLLQRALLEEFEGTNAVVKLSKWPVLTFSLTGKGYNSTITADVAESISEIQKAVNRAYAATVKNQASATHLTNQEKSSLRFKAKVSKGSSIVSIDLSPAAQAIANNLVGKMTGTEIIISVLGLGAIWGATAVSKQIIKSRADNKNISDSTKHALGMSQEETRKIQVVSDSMARITQLAHAKADFENIGHELLKSVGDADQININGVSVDKKSAYELSRGTRQASKEVQLNGQYTVAEASFKREDATKILVHNLGDGREFSAAFQDDSLEGKQLTMLKDAAFEKKPVFLSINGTELRGQITTATIIEVRKIEK